MGPYLTRKYTSSMTESQKSQKKKETLVTKSISTLKSDTKKESKTEDGPRMKNTRIIALKDSLTKKQIHPSTETIKNDRKEINVIRREVIDKKETKPAVKVMTNNSLGTDKQELKNIKKRRIRKTSNENIHNLKQTLLRESFLNQSKKKLLHVGQKIESSQSDLTLIKQHLLPKKQNSVVLIKKLNTKKEKMPVYKGISPEHSIKNASDIYEFNFDVNDSKERLPRKKRKRVTGKKALVPKEKKTIFKKHNVRKVVDHKTESSNVEFKEGNIKFINVKPAESDVGCINEAPKENNIKSTNVAHKENNIKPTSVTFQEIKEKKLNQSLQANISMEPTNGAPLLEDDEESFISNTKLNPEPLTHLISDTTNTEQYINNIIKKPEIVSIQDLSNQTIIVTNNSKNCKSNDFKPFRPTNIFNNKLMIHQKNTFTTSLFEKSLSPIAKLSENNEFNSPWRVPPLLMFSQVRNVFQSTPQNKKYEISKKTFSRVIMNESKSNENTRGKDASLRNNENISPERYINANYCRKKNSTSRKFGTEITNIDHSVSSNVGEEINERISNEIENIQSNVESSNMVNTSVDHFSTHTHHNIENRINCITNPRSPKKVVKIDKNKIQSPQKIVENKQIHNQKENLDPQPGPSGLQRNRVFSEEKNILRQSNLNNFLNIMDIPQSTSFKTAHGIFDDGPSTPISAKPAKQSNKSNLDIKNAFGFSDDDSTKDISLVKHKITTNENQKKKPFTTNTENNEKSFARLSMSEIQNKFLVDKPLKNIKPVKNIKNEDIIKKVPLKLKQDVHIDISNNFSDTFDVLSEMGESCSMINTSEVPLFVDPEPSHFTQPPKHSYKRKRNVKFNFSDEECEEEERFLDYEIKRKKTNKMKKNQEKRLIEWVENINKTFDEIDQYELLIE